MHSCHLCLWPLCSIVPRLISKAWEIYFIFNCELRACMSTYVYLLLCRKYFQMMKETSPLMHDYSFQYSQKELQIISLDAIQRTSQYFYFQIFYFYLFFRCRKEWYILLFVKNNDLCVCVEFPAFSIRRCNFSLIKMKYLHVQ